MKNLLIAGACFLLGFLFAKDLYNPIENASKIITKEKECKSPKVAQKKLQKKSSVLHSELVATNKNPVFKTKISKKNSDKLIETLITEKVEEGVVTFEKKSPYGGRYTQEKLSDGTIIDREYTAKNILLGESKKKDGLETRRVFYENGLTKGLEIKFSDGSITNTIQDLNGIKLGKKHVKSNGDIVRWDYNEYGEVTRKFFEPKKR